MQCSRTYYVSTQYFCKQVMGDEKERKKERRRTNGDFCSGISRLHERLGKLRG